MIYQTESLDLAHAKQKRSKDARAATKATVITSPRNKKARIEENQQQSADKENTGSHLQSAIAMADHSKTLSPSSIEPKVRGMKPRVIQKMTSIIDQNY